MQIFCLSILSVFSMPLQFVLPAILLINTAPMWPSGTTVSYSQTRKEVRNVKKWNIPNSHCPATLTLRRLYKSPLVAELERKKQNEAYCLDHKGWREQTTVKTAASSTDIESSLLLRVVPPCSLTCFHSETGDGLVHPGNHFKPELRWDVPGLLSALRLGMI